MPSTVVSWTETVLHASQVFFAMLELDMRSAQNTLRFLRALKSEELPYEKLRYVLNRAPGSLDMTGKGRVKRLAESLDIKIEVLAPELFSHTSEFPMDMIESMARRDMEARRDMD